MITEERKHEIQKQMPDNYFLQSNDIWINGQDDKPARYIIQVLYITQVKREIFTGEEKYQLRYLNGDKWSEVSIDASVLTLANIDSLVKVGIDVTPSNRSLVATYLVNQRHLAPVINQYDRVGWQKIGSDNKLSFLANNIIPKRANDGDWQHDDTSLNLTPAGAIEDYLSQLTELTKDNFNLLMAVIIGLSASLMWPCKQWIDKDLTTLVVNFVGSSSTGKTSAASMAISVAGDPSVTSNGPASTWKQTKNALFASLQKNEGIPRLLDELNTYPYADVSSVIYDLSNGQEKKRLNKESKLRDVASWCTTIISTAEISIFTKTASANDGLRIRVLELNIPSWTVSAEESGKVKMFAANYYGTLLPAFVERLLVNGVDNFKEKLRDTYERCYNSILPLLPETKFKERIAARCAVITTTGMMASDIFNWDIKLESLDNWLIKALSLDFAEDVGERAAQDTVEWLIANQSSLQPKGSRRIPHVVIGRIEDMSDSIRCDVLKNTLFNQLTDMGYEDPHVIINLWLKNGFIKPSTDRPTMRSIIGGTRSTAYRLNINKRYRDEFKNTFLEFDELLERQNPIKVNKAPTNPLIDELEKYNSKPSDLSSETLKLDDED